MSTRDSGVIDLFAIHKEEEARISAAPSAPPPAVSFDLGNDDDLDALAVSQQASRKRAKIIGGAIGAMAVVGILIAAITSGGSKPTATAAAAAAPPPPVAVAVAPPPAVEPAPAPAPIPAPPPTAKGKADYTPATAAAAFAASQSHGKKKASVKSAAKSGGTKLQKVQSAGTT